MDAVTIDVSACEHFIEDFHPLELQKAMNSRVNVTLRPSSTDHAVFLQVRRPVNVVHLWSSVPLLRIPPPVCGRQPMPRAHLSCTAGLCSALQL